MIKNPCNKSVLCVRTELAVARGAILEKFYVRSKIHVLCSLLLVGTSSLLSNSVLIFAPLQIVVQYQTGKIFTLTVVKITLKIPIASR